MKRETEVSGWWGILTKSEGNYSVTHSSPCETIDITDSLTTKGNNS